jgi:hypothetical protein
MCDRDANDIEPTERLPLLWLLILEAYQIYRHAFFKKSLYRPPRAWVGGIR